MKTKLITILILILPILGFSQINQSIDFVSGLDYSFRQLSNSSEDPIIELVKKNRDELEIGKLNWRIGFNYNNKLSSKIFLRTGIRLASVGYKTKKIGLRFGSQHDGMGGFTPSNDPSLTSEIRLVTDYWFIEMPVAGRYEISQKKIAPFIEFGISPSIYLTTKNKSKTNLSSNSEFDKEDIIKNFHVVGFISFGINYSLNEKFQFFGQPVFRYHFKELADTPISERLFNCGIEIGVRRKIK